MYYADIFFQSRHLFIAMYENLVIYHDRKHNIKRFTLQYTHMKACMKKKAIINMWFRPFIIHEYCT